MYAVDLAHKDACARDTATTHKQDACCAARDVLCRVGGKPVEDEIGAGKHTRVLPDP